MFSGSGNERLARKRFEAKPRRRVKNAASRVVLKQQRAGAPRRIDRVLMEVGQDIDRAESQSSSVGTGVCSS